MASPRSARTAGSAAIIGVVLLLATGCASGPASSARIAEVAGAQGIAPELVFTTAVEGYDLAPQSVGSSGNDGMSATWFNAGTSGMLTIRTDRGTVTPETCAAQPLDEAPDQVVTCADEDGVWHRSAGEVHEFIAVRDDALIRVTGAGAPAEDLRAAAEAVRVPSADELVALFSDAPRGPAVPVERGDIPENGDGAPIDPTGPGG